MSESHEEITCAAAQSQLAMLLYGELSFGEEEQLESHLDVCTECRAALQRERALHAALRTAEIEPSPSLLRECRENLHERMMEQPAPAPAGWWRKFTDMFTQRPGMMILRPAATLALIALGFIGGRLMTTMNLASDGTFEAMGVSGPAASRVRSVESAADGRVQIVLDETHPRVVSGRLEDANIRGLLLGAARDSSDAGLRAETVGILNRSAQSADVRDALIYAVRHDQSADVRLKAMEGLKGFTQEADVRGALSQVLLSDGNPGVRTQAIDLLTSAPGVDQEIVGTLQELMERGEEQGDVRERAVHVLKSMKASFETY